MEPVIYRPEGMPDAVVVTSLDLRPGRGHLGTVSVFFRLAGHEFTLAGLILRRGRGRDDAVRVEPPTVGETIVPAFGLSPVVWSSIRTAVREAVWRDRHEWEGWR